MAKKNANTRNAKHQAKAERRQRKAKRNSANVRRAMDAKKDLLTNSATTHYRTNDLSFDSKTDQVFLVALKCGCELVTNICVTSQDNTDRDLINMAQGLAFSREDCDGAMALIFPPSWTVDEVMKKTSTDIWGTYVMVTLVDHPGRVLFAKGEKIAEVVNEIFDSFVDWISDCGAAPDQNGYVDVDVNSSAIKHVKYDTFKRSMYITFANGAKYKYDDVPRKRFTGLVSDGSVGGYFNAWVRDEYEYKRVA